LLAKYTMSTNANPDDFSPLDESWATLRNILWLQFSIVWRGCTTPSFETSSEATEFSGLPGDEEQNQWEKKENVYILQMRYTMLKGIPWKLSPLGSQSWKHSDVLQANWLLSWCNFLSVNGNTVNKGIMHHNNRNRTRTLVS